MRKRNKQRFKLGVVLGRMWRTNAFGMMPSQRECSRRQVASAEGKKPPFLSRNKEPGEAEHELACAAMIFWEHAFLEKGVEGKHERNLEETDLGSTSREEL